MELYKYAMTHFQMEKAHMGKIKYPFVKSHRKFHDKFIVELNHITEDFSNDNFNELKMFSFTLM